MSQETMRSVLILGGTALLGVVLSGIGLGAASYLGWIGNSQSAHQAVTSGADPMQQTVTASIHDPAKGNEPDTVDLDAAVMAGDPADDAAEPIDFVAECDRVAAHPDDPEAVTRGVADASFDPALAIDVCWEAFNLGTGEQRLAFQLGRALLDNGDLVEAEKFLRPAADAGHGGAQAYLAEIFIETEELNSNNLAQIAALLDHAVQNGFAPARARLQEVQAYITANEPTFDPALFANGEIMKALYEGDFEALNNLGPNFLVEENNPGLPKTFTLYAMSLAETFNQPFYGCPTKIQAGVSGHIARKHDAIAINTVTRDPMAGWKMIGDLFKSAGVGRNDPGQVWGNVLQRTNDGAALTAELADQGKKDAYVLKGLYADCTAPNPIADRILENLARYALDQQPLKG